MDNLFEKLTVVIPTLNEEKAIGKVIDELLELGLSPSQILVVDGHSTDRTVDIARSKGVNVVFQEGRGKADAIKTALKYVKTPYILFMDGDYTYPAKHIPELLEAAERRGYAEVIGARLYGRENIPLLFRFGNWALTKLFNLLFGTRLRDVLSGMYLVKREFLEDMDFSTKGFSIESEIAAHIASTGGEIGEVPIVYRQRLGEKKLKVRHGIRIALDMIKLAWRYNPVFLVTLIGASLLVPGLALSAYVAYDLVVHGVKHYVKGLIAAILVAIGLNSLVLAILSVYIKRAEIRILRRIRMCRCR